MSSVSDFPSLVPAGDEQRPLAAFNGAHPPSPAWFEAALAAKPERSVVRSLGTGIETLTWGQVGRPGLLLVHGTAAHAEWWRFIAPFFADAYRVVAFSLPGCGASDWRERYTFDDFVVDAATVCEETGLRSTLQPPIGIGHSRGGTRILHAAARAPDLMRAVISIDTHLGRPRLDELKWAKQLAAGPPARQPRPRPLRDILQRFYFLPPQTVRAPYVADFIARQSLINISRTGGDEWIYRGDPDTNQKSDLIVELDLGHYRPDIPVPVARLYGSESTIVSRGPEDSIPPVDIAIPDAGHHVMVDQPLALVTALRALLAGWIHR